MHNEILVTFSKLEGRDVVTSCAKNLAEAVDAKGNQKPA